VSVYINPGALPEQTINKRRDDILNNKLTMKNYTLHAFFQRRVKQNFADFKADMLMRGEEEIFENARRIAVVTDTYEQLTREDICPLTDSDAIFLLRFYSPLEMIADFVNPPVIEEDVEDAVEEAINADGLEDCYLTVDYAEELFEKYGDDTHIKIAMLEEALEAGIRYERLMTIAMKATADIKTIFDEDIFDEDGFFIYRDDKEGCF